MKVILCVLLSLGSFFLISFDTGNTFPGNAHRPKAIPYDLEDPHKKYKLKDRLDEISGLSYISSKKIACIQDEKGNIYQYNFKKEDSKKIVDFGKSGDYEGVEIIGEHAYVLESNGTIHEVLNYKDSITETIPHNGFLSRKYDTEGLAWHAKENSLLIACKERAGEGDFFNGKKAVYSFNLEKKIFEREPWLLFDVEDIKDQLAMSSDQISLYASLEPVIAGSEYMKFDPKPSGIAIHPKTGDIYIITTVDQLLIVFSKKKKLKAVVRLNDKYFSQPEGICFEPDGDLIISNEKNDKSSNILKFKYHN